MAVPTDFSNLTMWLEADAITGRTDGQEVTTWEDSSSANNDATGSAGTAPTYQTNELNGMPVVRFDGSGDNLTSAASRSAVTQTVVVLMRPTALGASRTVFGCSASGGLRLSIGDTGYLLLTSAATAFIMENYTATMEAGEWAILVARFSDTANTYSVRKDGASYGSGSTSVTLATGVTHAFHRNGGWDDAYGDFAEVISYDAYLSDSDVAELEAYLDAKWLTASTPAEVTPSVVAATAAVDTFPVRNAQVVVGGESKQGVWT